jgi:hypothetical protein
MSDNTLTIDSKHIVWVPYTAAKNSKQTIKFCYANMQRSGLTEQLEAMLKKDILPRHVDITGKKKMQMKIEVYQNDGFWFSAPRGKGEILWRLWVEAGLLLNPPTKSKLLKVAKKVKK